MSDEQGEQGKAVLTISLGEAGVQVNGPLNDKMLCYALLEHARDAIKDFNDNAAKAEQRIAPPSPHDMKLLTRRVQ